MHHFWVGADARPERLLTGLSLAQLTVQYQAFCVECRFSTVDAAELHVRLICEDADARIAHEPENAARKGQILWLGSFIAAWEAEEDAPVVEEFEDVLRQEADQAGTKAEAAYEGQAQ